MYSARFLIVAEATLFLERENHRSMQLDLELRHHAFLRDEKLQQESSGTCLTDSLISLVEHSCLRSLPSSRFPGLDKSDTLTMGQAARGVASLLEQDRNAADTDSAGTLAVSCDFSVKNCIQVSSAHNFSVTATDTTTAVLNSPQSAPADAGTSVSATLAQVSPGKQEV